MTLETNENEVVTSQELATSIVEAMQEKKAVEICMIDLRQVKNSIADFFVICSGNSDTQVDAIKNSVEGMTFKDLGEKPWKTEGAQEKEWILLDYGNVVAHVFQKAKRKFYGLEELWGDGIIKNFD